MSGAGPLRVHVAAGSRRPDTRRLRPGEVVLDAGAVHPLPSGVRRVAARDLLGAAEADDLQRRCLAFATSWHSGAAVPGAGDVAGGRAIESEALLDLGQALKHLAILRRLASREGPIVAVVDPLHPALGRLRGALAGVEPSISLEPAGGAAATAVRRATRRVRSALRGPAAGSSRRERAGGAGASVVWGMQNYRNRPILDALEADGRFAVRRFERGAENAYLRERAPAARLDGDGAVLERAARVAGTLFPDLPGAERVAASVVEDLLARVAPAALGQVEAWRGALEELRPGAIVSGIPWGGDLRALAIAARSIGVPVLACQDGILCERGAGGVPVGSGALTWGPRGSDWFARRGFPPEAVHAVGDPWLERLRQDVRDADAARTRRRLSIPEGTKVLVASVQNSAPHDLGTDPADPVRALRALLRAVEGADDWTLVAKPHPRMARVDGEGRLRLVRRLASEARRAVVADPAEPVANLLRVADAHVGEGDTLSFEAVACGTPSILVPLEGVPLPYPEFAATGAMPVVASSGDLRDLLTRGPEPPAGDAARRLLDEHLRPSVSPAEAVAAAVAAGAPGGEGGSAS